MELEGRPQLRAVESALSLGRGSSAAALSGSAAARSVRTYDRSVGDLASIGYNGQPLRNPFRVVRPPVTVLVDLTVLFPREPHRTGRYHPNGLQLHKVVEGQLSCWGICEQGDWWGLVSYPIAYGSKRKTVTHWVPAWVLRRR
jgi:hypothetical protein